MLLQRTEILARAAEELASILAAARSARSSPDYRGSEWMEACVGNRLLPLYVMVDFLGNVLHIKREGTSFAREEITVTYLPSWFVVALGGRPLFDTPITQVSDRDLAVPLRMVIKVEHPTAATLPLMAPGVPPLPGAKTRTAVLPQISYDLQPSQGSMLLKEGADPQQVAALDPADGMAFVDRMHWIAPSIKLTLAPGVGFQPEELYPIVDTGFDPWSLDLSSTLDAVASSPFWGWFVMTAAREQDDAIRAPLASQVTSQQALQVLVERFQNPEALPPPGAPRRAGGVSEVDLMSEVWGPFARFEEQTRPDGVDLLFLTSHAAAQLAAQRADPMRALRAMIETYVSGFGGGLPLSAPIPVSLRVDVQSADDRFAYTVTTLPRDDGGQLFRLSVIRTPKVRVYVDWFFGPQGSDQIKRILDFRELVVDDMEKVPIAILDDGQSLPVVWPPRRELTNAELFDLTVMAIGLVPWPPCQVFSDLTDYATILLYLSGSKDPFGRDVGALDFAGSLAGIILPEILEPVAKKAIRLVSTWDGPGRRIFDTFLGVKPADLGATVIPLLEASTP